MRDRRLDAPVILAGAVAAGAAVLAARAFLIEPARVLLSRHDLPVPDLPPAWNGARVVHLSDLHYGDPRSERLFCWMIERVNALAPDLIVITGDFILHRESEVVPCVRHLGGLRARHGILGVLGDHDYWRPCGAGKEAPPRPMPGLVEALAGAGVRLLRNAWVELPGGLRVAGTDPTTRKVWQGDLRRALGGPGAPPPHLLLTHSPDLLPQAAALGVPVVLCGHTHGGQVVLPLFGPPVTHTRVGRRHASGWSRRGGTLAYTCRGLASHCSLRFLCPPEIVLFTLRPA